MLPAPLAAYRRFVKFLYRHQVQIHSRNSVWRNAFAPASRVWNGIGGYSVALSHRTGMLWSWRRRFVIPLFERDMVSMPRPSWALVPSPEARYRLRDKAQFERHARLHGLCSFLPATFDPDAPTVFPAVLKRTDRSSAEGVVVVESQAELKAQRASPLFANQPVLLQEFIDDDTDYVTHLVAANGAIVWHVTYAFGLADGRTMRGPRNYESVAASEISPAELDLFERFLRPLAFSGPANIDFRRRPDGAIAILEINPRFGLSLLRPEHVADLRAAVGAILAHATLHP